MTVTNEDGLQRCVLTKCTFEYIQRRFVKLDGIAVTVTAVDIAAELLHIHDGR